MLLSNYLIVNYSRISHLNNPHSLATCLKTLVQMREGRTWTFELPHNTVDTITTFTSDLMNEGLVQKILDVLISTGYFRNLLITLVSDLELYISD